MPYRRGSGSKSMGEIKYFLMFYDSLGKSGVVKRIYIGNMIETYYYRDGDWRLAPGIYDRKSIVKEITKLEAMMEIL